MQKAQLFFERAKNAIFFERAKNAFFARSNPICAKKAWEAFFGCFFLTLEINLRMMMSTCCAIVGY